MAFTYCSISAKQLMRSTNKNSRLYTNANRIYKSVIQGNNHMRVIMFAVVAVWCGWGRGAYACAVMQL